MTLLEKVREENRQAQERADNKAQERDRKESARHWRTFALSVIALVVSVAIGIANSVFTMLKK
jgi:anti-sigma-K factor RskA